MASSCGGGSTAAGRAMVSLRSNSMNCWVWAPSAVSGALAGGTRVQALHAPAAGAPTARPSPGWGRSRSSRAAYCLGAPGAACRGPAAGAGDGADRCCEKLAGLPDAPGHGAPEGAGAVDAGTPAGLSAPVTLLSLRQPLPAHAARDTPPQLAAPPDAPVGTAHGSLMGSSIRNAHLKFAPIALAPPPGALQQAPDMAQRARRSAID